MQTVMTTGDLFRQGRLNEAIDAAAASVKRRPLEAASRILFSELLLFAGDFARADNVLEAAGTVEPAAALAVAEFRQLLRAATACRQVAREGRMPDLLGGPTPSQTSLVRALMALREGDEAAAASAADAAELARQPAPGTHNGVAFRDFRDADDLCAGVIDVLTTTGKHFWVPIERVETATFHPPVRVRDLFWRRCSMTVRGGPEGDVYVPAIYDHDRDTGDRLRLGRETEWTTTAPIRGTGQRVFFTGSDGVPIHELGTIEIH